MGSMWHDWFLVFEIVEVVALSTLTVGLMRMVAKSRNWAAARQDDILTVLRSELDILKGTVLAIDNSLGSWRTGFLDSEKRVWEQLRILNVGIGHIRDIEARLGRLEDAMQAMTNGKDISSSSPGETKG